MSARDAVRARDARRIHPEPEKPAKKVKKPEKQAEVPATVEPADG